MVRYEALTGPDCEKPPFQQWMHAGQRTYLVEAFAGSWKEFTQALILKSSLDPKNLPRGSSHSTIMKLSP